MLASGSLWPEHQGRGGSGDVCGREEARRGRPGLWVDPPRTPRLKQPLPDCSAPAGICHSSTTFPKYQLTEVTNLRRAADNQCRTA
jgi:hypothetical protein